MSRTFKPIFDRVVIKREKSALERKATKAGLVMADTVKSNYQSSEGILISVGEDCCELVKGMVGNKILFAKYSGDDLPKDWYGNDSEYVLASEVDIFGTIEGEAE